VEEQNDSLILKKERNGVYTLRSGYYVHVDKGGRRKVPGDFGGVWRDLISRFHRGCLPIWDKLNVRHVLCRQNVPFAQGLRIPIGTFFLYVKKALIVGK